MSNDEDIKSLKHRIWTTATTRIYAKSRARQFDIISHLTLVLLTVYLIAITIFKENFPSHILVDQYILILSILALAASILVWGFRFGEKATLHKQCYLRLNDLRDRKIEYEEMVRQYHNILAAFPNHTDADYEHFILASKFIHNRPLKNLDDEDIPTTWCMIVHWVFRALLIWILPLAIFSSIFWLW